MQLKKEKKCIKEKKLMVGGLVYFIFENQSTWLAAREG